MTSARLEEKNAVSPRELAFLERLAYRLIRAERLTEARAVAEGVVALRPDHYYGHAIAGVLAERAGEREEARRCYERALQCNPRDTASMLNLGRLRLQAGEIAAGRKELSAIRALEGAQRSEVGRLADLLLESFGGER
jgi:Flp pilus assembly protein TadD